MKKSKLAAVTAMVVGISGCASADYRFADYDYDDYDDYDEEEQD